MSRMFRELVTRSRRITRDEFATSFGGIADDVLEMLDSDQARQVVGEARQEMELAEPFEDGRQTGLFHSN